MCPPSDTRGADALTRVDGPARRATEFQFGPFHLGAKRMPNDSCRHCPVCSNKGDEDDKAPLVPGVTKTDDRSPLFAVTGDGCAKATRFKYAGKAQKELKHTCSYFFGAANERFAASVSETERAAAVAAPPQDRNCGGNQLRCVKTDNIKSALCSSVGLVMLQCCHGISLVGSAIDCVVHGARVGGLISRASSCMQVPLTRATARGVASENMTMYDMALEDLRKERKVCRFVLDNCCLYKLHALRLDPNDDLEFLVPVWHALGHVYVRNPNCVYAVCVLTCGAPARSLARWKTVRCIGSFPHGATTRTMSATGSSCRPYGRPAEPARRCVSTHAQSRDVC